MFTIRSHRSTIESIPPNEWLIRSSSRRNPARRKTSAPPWVIVTETLLEPEDVVPEWKRWSPILLRPAGLYGTRPAEGGNKAAKLRAIREDCAPPSGFGSPPIVTAKGLEGASHHAVIPNVNTIDKLREVWPRLSSDEKKLFDVIARAYLAALMPDYRYRLID